MHPSDEQPHAEITPHRPTKSDEGFTMTTNISVLISAQMLRIGEVEKLLGVNRSTVYDWMDVKSKRYDASFPKQVKVGPRAVRWVESQLAAWIESKISAQ